MELEKMSNLGPVLAGRLRQAGIPDGETLRAVGSEAAFLRLRAQDPTVCFHMLTAIEGAVEGVRKTQLSPARRAELRTFFDSLK